MEEYQKEKIINKYYSNAVEGLIKNESILLDFNDWNGYSLDLPKKEFVTYTISLFDWQIKNGGFHQYFFNSYGIFCFYTVENLKEINCLKHADLLEKAISIIYDKSEKKSKFKQKIFDRQVDKINSFDEIIFKKFEQLEDEYDLIEENDEIFNKLATYLTK
jgi:hypothetical protein